MVYYNPYITGYYNHLYQTTKPRFFSLLIYISKKSPTGPTEWTPKKSKYLLTRSKLIERGPLVRSHLIFDDKIFLDLLVRWLENMKKHNKHSPNGDLLR